MKLRPPAPLDRSRHRSDDFRCGQPKLDTWLRASAGQAQRRDARRTYVISEADDVILGCYTLVAGQVSHEEATSDVGRGMSKHFPIPVVVLARLAVDDRRHGKGLGAALLAHATRRAVHAAEEVGIRAVVVDAIDARAAEFYRRFGFGALDADGLRLMATVAKLRDAIGIRASLDLGRPCPTIQRRLD